MRLPEYGSNHRNLSIRGSRALRHEAKETTGDVLIVPGIPDLVTAPAGGTNAVAPGHPKINSAAPRLLAL